MKKVSKLLIGVLSICGLGTLASCDLSKIKDIIDKVKPVESTNIPENTIMYDDFQVHFLELGNKNAGDSVYIKAGDNDILIDAGSKTSSATTIENYVDKYCTDNKLEYVIATHAHEDHIASMSGVKEKNGYNGILYHYNVDNIITFSQTATASNIYKNFLNAVDYCQNKGTKVYYASDFFDKNHNPKQSSHISLGDNISMDILYNQYYFEYAGDENNSSVITMFNYNDHHFLFSGDLEKEGEEAMMKYYDNSTEAKTLPEVDLFKAGHHGSKTSSNDCLLSQIKPKICVACCCAGTTEYTDNRVNTFPTQEFINRIAKYTDAVYITSMWNEETEKFESMNGNVVVSCDGTNIGLSASNNLIKLKDTEWFSHNVYVNDKDKIVSKDTEGAKTVPCRTMPKEWR